MAILTKFPGASCDVCGKPPSVLLIDSPVGSLCKECYGADEIVVDPQTNRKVAVRMKWQEVRR